MQNSGFFRILIVFSLFLAAANLYGSSVDSDSIFYDARRPASLLDLKLLEIKSAWFNAYCDLPNKEAIRERPLIIKSRVSIDPRYTYDKIHVTGWIRNLNGFLSLTQDEKKQLVKNVLYLIERILRSNISLVDKETGRLKLFSKLERRHIKLTMRLNEPMYNTKDENIRLILPYNFGIGQAGYLNGQFLYSEDYYLGLQVIGGKAKAGDASKFVIERE
jgi:hypothetical protein